MDFEDDNNLDFQQNNANIEDEIYVNTDYKTMNDAVIFLVDLQISDSNIFNQIFNITENFLKTKIITNDKDLFGLFFFNAPKSSNSLNLEGVNILFNVSSLDALLIKKIKHLYNNYNHQPSNIQFSLNNALWVCQTELKAFDSNYYNRRIFLFTENDFPVLDDEDRKITIQRAKDMLDTDMIIELFPMNTKENSIFNVKKFYADILSVYLNDNNQEINEDYYLNKEYSHKRIQEITRRIRQKDIKKRAIGNCDFKFSNNLEFKVNFYATIRKSNKPSAININSLNNKELNQLIQPICKDSSTSLFPNQIGTCINYGNTKVPFNKQDLNKIKILEKPGLKLVGFKCYSSLKPYFNIKSSYFIYPDEDLNPGSSQFCDSLINQLKAKSKIAICRFVPREGCGIRICALLPQKEAFDEDYFQTPPGFNIVFLPFADEIRLNSVLFENCRKNYSIDYLENAKEEEINLAKKLIKKMSVEYDATNFNNVTMQKFYSYLQALALDEEKLDNITDNMLPDKDSYLKLKNCDIEFWNYFNRMKVDDYLNIENIEKDELKENVDNKLSNSVDNSDNINNYINKKNNVNNSCTSINDNNEYKSTNKKREGIKDNTLTNRIKENKVYSDEELLNIQEKDTLRDLTVTSLKVNLDSRNIKYPYKSKKDELIIKLETYLMDLDI